MLAMLLFRFTSQLPQICLQDPFALWAPSGPYLSTPNPLLHISHTNSFGMAISKWLHFKVFSVPHHLNTSYFFKN